MTYSSSSLNFLVRLLQAAALCPPRSRSFLYKLQCAYFTVNGFTVIGCAIYAIFTEDTFTAIQGGSIVFGVFNSVLKVMVLGLTDKFPRIIDGADNIYKVLSQQKITASAATAADKEIHDRCLLIFKLMLLYFPLSIGTALYKVYFLGLDSLLIAAYTTPKMPHYSMTLVLQLMMIGPVWLDLTAYMISLVGITSLIRVFVRSLIQIIDAQELDHIDSTVYEVHTSIIKNVSEINRNISSLFLAEMLLSPFQSCFCAYGTLVGLKNTDSIEGYYAAILLVFSSVLPLFLSLSCQTVIDEGEHLHNSLYRLKWDERSARLRKDVLIMAALTGKGLQFQYRRVFTFNMERFCEYLQCVMSYITLIQNLGIK